MKYFEIEGSLFKIRSSGQLSGCVFTLIGIMGIFLTIVGIIALVFSDGAESKFTGGFVSLIGFVMFYAGLFSPAKGFKEEIYFDNSQEKIRIANNRQKEHPLAIAYHELSHLHCLETYLSNSRSRYPVHCLYAVKQDGSEIFLYTSSRAAIFKDMVTELALFTGLEIRDTSKLNLSQEKKKDYRTDSRGFSESELFFSKFIDESIPSLDKEMNPAFYSGKVLRLKQAKKTILERIFSFMILAFFMAIPISLILMAFQNPDQSKIFLIFMIPFSLLFLSIFFMMIILSLKDYILAIDGSGIRLRLIFRLRLFSGLDRDLQIPREKIEFVRVNRADNGFFWLALGVKDDFSMSGMGSQFLFGTGVFKKENIAKASIRKEKVISLWEISPWHKEGEGPTVRDLQTLEKIMEERLNLREGKI